MTADGLVAMVPSPKKAEILQALQSGKAVFISVSRKGMAKQTDASTACAMDCGQVKDQCVTKCPTVFPGVLTRDFWPIDDPADAAGNSPAELEQFRQARDEISKRLEEWLKETSVRRSR